MFTFVKVYIMTIYLIERVRIGGKQRKACVGGPLIIGGIMVLSLAIPI